MATVEPLKNVKQHTVYKNKANKRVVGTTTALDVLNKRALIKWANDLGLQGIDSSKYVDKLSRIGTLAHERIACELQGEEPDLEAYSKEEIDLSDNSLLSYYSWLENHTILPILVEKPLVSEEYQYGGTVDVYGTVDGKPSLVDLKTSKGIFPEHLYQLAAYHNLLIEHGYDVENVRILRIGRTEDEGFEDRVVDVEALPPYFDVFKHCRALYDLLKITKGV